MKNFVISLFVILVSVAARAQIEFGVAAGLRSSQADTDLASATVDSRSGFQAGALFYFPFASNWGLRSGFLYTQRFVTLLNTKAGSVDINFSYFDIPATPMIRFSDYAGVFAGPVLSFNQSKEVSCSNKSSDTCNAMDVKSVVMPWQLGLQFRFLPQAGAEIFYEYTPGDLATNVANMRAVGGNVIFFFE